MSLSSNLAESCQPAIFLLWLRRTWGNMPSPIAKTFCANFCKNEWIGSMHRLKLYLMTSAMQAKQTLWGNVSCLVSELQGVKRSLYLLDVCWFPLIDAQNHLAQSLPGTFFQWPSFSEYDNSLLQFFKAIASNFLAECGSLAMVVHPAFNSCPEQLENYSCALLLSFSIIISTANDRLISTDPKCCHNAYPSAQLALAWWKSILSSLWRGAFSPHGLCSFQPAVHAWIQSI